jgi:hypothetical protein
MVIVNTQTEEHAVTIRSVSNAGRFSSLLNAEITRLDGEIVRHPDAAAEGRMRYYQEHYLSRIGFRFPTTKSRMGYGNQSDISLMMYALHAAFAEHIPYSIGPDMIWYSIAHEVAVHIDQNQDRYRGYFTVSDEKETLIVRDDSLVYGGNGNQWARSINLIREPMRAKVPKATIDLLMPVFSTTTEESSTALLVLFMNILSKYYELEWMTLCGIPSIRIEGDADDWKKIVEHAELASKDFSGLQDYFNDLIPVLKEIAGVAAGDEPDPEFWEAIYNYNNESGGPYINGWITALLAHKKDGEGGFNLRDDFGWRANAKNPFGGLTSNDLPNHISNVPFKWKYSKGGLEKTFDMEFISGVFGVDFDGYLTPKLGYGVLENIEATT